MVAKWKCERTKYIVDFATDGGTPIDPIVVDFGGVINQPPADPIKPDDLFYEYKFNSWHKILDDGSIEQEPFSFNEQINEDITLKALYDIVKTKKYHVNKTSSEGLYFRTINDEIIDNIEVETGASFKFRVYPMSDPNGEVWRVPNHIDIRIRNRTFIDDCYTIEYDDEYHLAATVTIKQGIINGDVNISGKAIKDNYYVIDGRAFDCSFTPCAYALCNEDYTIQFSGLSGYSRPDQNGIMIKVDDNPCWTPLSLSATICEYDESTGQLRIKKDTIKNSFEFIAYTADKTCLEALSWDCIREMAYTASSIDYFFKVGDTKDIVLLENGQLQSFTHQIRIIGIDHDEIDVEKKAKLTFEFANLITKNDGKAFQIKWNKKANNYNFVNSPLNNSLNNNHSDYSSIFGMIPEDLYDNLSHVQKKVGYGGESHKMNSYFAWLFPLCVEEIGDNTLWPYVAHAKKEGTRYEYYKDSKRKDRIKYPADVSSDSNGGDSYNAYWLRSPTVEKEGADYDEQAFVIVNEKIAGHDPGKMWVPLTNENCCVAPAFCI